MFVFTRRWRSRRVPPLLARERCARSFRSLGIRHSGLCAVKADRLHGLRPAGSALGAAGESARVLELARAGLAVPPLRTQRRSPKRPYGSPTTQSKLQRWARAAVRSRTLGSAASRPFASKHSCLTSSQNGTGSLRRARDDGVVEARPSYDGEKYQWNSSIKSRCRWSRSIADLRFFKRPLCSTRLDAWRRIG